MPNASDPAALPLAARALYGPVAEWLGDLPAGPLPDLAALNRCLAAAAPQAVSGGGAPIRFVPPPTPEEMGYEARIHRDGTVPTRPDNWHDFFNALVWCAFPLAKAAMNARHQAEIDRRAAAGQSGRGPVRDALTQFDECGVAVVSSRPELLDLLRGHAWEAAFWTHREELRRSTRFIVFGHATYDLLRAPFFGLCAKALYRPVAADWLDLSWPDQRRELDAWLAGWFAAPGHCAHPREFSPVPLLGIPGVTPENEDVEYYRDVRQFRPARATARRLPGRVELV